MALAKSICLIERKRYWRMRYNESWCISIDPLSVFPNIDRFFRPSIFAVSRRRFDVEIWILSKLGPN